MTATPLRTHRAPTQALPPGATDCHLHVLGPYARFPLVAERAYTAPEALLEEHERMKRIVGLERTVLVQASAHGTDNSAMIAALARLGARGRGVAVVDPGAPARDMELLHAAGVRGVRLNFQTMRSRYAGDAGAWLAKFAALVAPYGWHLQLFCDAAMLAELESVLQKARTTIVIDHMGLPDTAGGLQQPGFQAVLRLVRAPHVWVKLAGADRITRSSGRLRDAVPFIRALADAAPERCVWGSDWPNIGFHPGTQEKSGDVLPYRNLDAGELLDVLSEAVPESAARRAILAGNPQRLYDFGL
jgi:2-pyrone-4,6-dicarboxylate lactonase